MAEAIAAASSIASLVELSCQVISTGYAFIAKAVRAPKEIRALLQELTAVNAVLSTLQDELSESTASFSEQRLSTTATAALEKLARLGALDACSELLRNAEAAVAAFERVQGQSVRNFGRRILWPLKEKEVLGLVQRLRSIRETINNAVVVDSAVALRRIEGNQANLQESVHDISDALAEEAKMEQDKRLMDWLTKDFVDPQDDLSAALEQHHPGTGHWLLESAEYNDWISGSPGLLWISGIPGSGKTTLSSTVIDHVQMQLGKSQDSIVLYFFFDQNDPKKQECGQLITSIAGQLLRSDRQCLEIASSSVPSTRLETGSKLRVAEYVNLFKAMGANFDRIFLFVDGLDECSEPLNLLETLISLSSEDLEEKSPWRLFLASRNSVSIQRRLSDLPCKMIALHQSNHEDVRRYISSEIKRRLTFGLFSVRDPKLPEMIEQTLVQTAQGLFLQAKLQLDYICDMVTDKAIREALTVFQPGLNFIYDRMLDQIRAKHPGNLSLVRSTLLWLSYSFGGGLSLESLPHAVAVHLENGEFEEDNVADAYNLVEKCKSFVFLEEAFSTSATVRLAHLSVSEYLQSPQVKACSSLFFMEPSASHLDLALACMRYLSSKQVYMSYYANEPKLFLVRNPFYRYAASKWAAHLRSANLSREQFLADVQPHLDWLISPVGSQNGFTCWRWFVDIAFTSALHPPIYFAVCSGLHHLVEVLLPSVKDINSPFSTGETLLTLTARWNWVKIGRILLDAGANPDMPADRMKCKGLAPLHFAAGQGHQQMTKLLLDRGAKVDIRSTTESTPFYRAARHGSVEIMTLLRDAGADINATTYDSYTPLIETIEQENQEACDALLGWGADPFIATDDGATTLSYAKYHGNKKIMAALRLAYAQSGQPIPSDYDLAEPAKIAWNVHSGPDGIRFKKPQISAQSN